MDTESLVKGDERLQKALIEAEKTKKLTPIIKEELRCTILARRCKENKGEIELEEKKTIIKMELTPDEVRKKLRRRQQNKDAARRCRAKKKVIESTVITDYFREQARAKQLQEEVTSLRNTLAQLKGILEEHALTCQLNQPQQSPPFYYQQTNNFTFPPIDERCCYTDSLVSERQVQNSTPLEDPFDDTFTTLKYADAVMYPYGHDHIKHGSTCTVTSEECYDDNMDTNLPSDLLDLEIPDNSVFLQPCSPDLILGRQSISEFPEEN